MYLTLIKRFRCYIFVTGKRVKNQNHKYTMHRNTTNSFISLGSNIKFSTKKAEKEQVKIKKKTCNNEQMEFLCA